MTELGPILPTSNVTSLGMGPGWSGEERAGKTTLKEKV